MSVVVLNIEMDFVLTALIKDLTIFQQIYLATLIHCKSVITKILAAFVIFIILNVTFFKIGKIN